MNAVVVLATVQQFIAAPMEGFALLELYHVVTHATIQLFSLAVMVLYHQPVLVPLQLQHLAPHHPHRHPQLQAHRLPLHLDHQQMEQLFT